MQENEFEKQVKHMMEELTFSPSEPVWGKIKKQLDEKRRRVLPFFFLLISIAIVSGYFLYSGNNHQTKTANKSNDVLHQHKQKLGVSKNTERKNQNHSTNSILKSNQSLTVNTIAENNKATVKKFSVDKTSHQHQSLIVNNNFKKITDTLNHEYTIAHSLQSNINDSDASAQQPIDTVYSFKNSVSENNADTLTKNNIEFIKIDTSNKNKKQQVKGKKLSTWQWGITALYGKSSITNKFLNIDLNKSAVNNTVQQNPSVSYNNGTVLQHAYSINDAYNFGIIIRKKISRHNYLNTGFSYVHLSAKSSTARNLDSSLILIVPADVATSSFTNNYYRLGTVKTYTNTFNFIELPVSFESNVFHIKQFSLSYYAGLSLRQLISSKSLIYDSYNNSFFSDNNILRKTQVQFIAGVNLQMKIKNTGTFLLGPQFAYSLSPYVKDNNYNRLHFLNYGLQASWLFSKK